MTTTNLPRAPVLVWLLAAFLTCFSCRTVAHTPAPEIAATVSSSLTIEFLLNSSGSLELHLKQSNGPPQEIEVTLYPVREREGGRIEIQSGEVRRQELRSLDDPWTLTLPLRFEESLRLAVEPLDPISGYPLADFTYLPLLPPAAALVPGGRWESHWDRRERSLGVWLLCHEETLTCDVTIDDSKLEAFLRY